MENLSFLSMTKTLMRSLFSKPATLMHPGKQRVYTQNTRGKIEIEIDNCIYCGLCAKRCLTDALTMSKPDKEWTIDSMKCIICGYCVEVCPKKCLIMNNSYSPSVTEKTSGIYKEKGKLQTENSNSI